MRQRSVKGLINPPYAAESKHQSVIRIEAEIRGATAVEVRYRSAAKAGLWVLVPALDVHRKAAEAGEYSLAWDLGCK